MKRFSVNFINSQMKHAKMTVLTHPSKSILEGVFLLVGVAALLSSAIYFLDAYGIIGIAYEISTETLILFFAVMTMVSGIVLIASTIGMIGLK